MEGLRVNNEKIINEYNSQDNEGTRNPYWVIRDYEKIYMNEDLYDYDGHTILYDDIEIGHIFENEEHIKTIRNLEKMIKDNISDCTKTIKSTLEEIGSFTPIDNIVDLIGEKFAVELEIRPFMSTPKDDFIFLSRKEAEEFLKEEKHHYSEKVHVFCKSNWGGSEFNKLMGRVEK